MVFQTNFDYWGLIERLTGGRGIYYPEARKISTIETTIAGKETVGGNQRMRTDKKVGRNPIASAAACPIPAPSLRGSGGGLFGHW